MLHDAAVKGLRPVLFKIQFDVLNNAGHYCATKVIFFINAGVCFFVFFRSKCRNNAVCDYLMQSVMQMEIGW